MVASISNAHPRIEQSSAIKERFAQTVGAAVAVDAVSKTFGNRQALDAVTIAAARGEIVALLGPNGGGKTTLFRIISTLMHPDSGAARVCGLDTVAEAAAVRRKIGVVFQSPSLDKKLTAAENLKHHGHLYGLRGSELTQRVTRMLDRLGVADRAGDRVETLSGGLARRVEIAKSMLPGPEVLLLDEPSTGLDPSARRDLWLQLDTLRKSGNVTALMTTHFTDEADRCDRVLVLDRGRLVADGTPDELKRRVGGDVIHIEADDSAATVERVNARFGVGAVVVGKLVRIETPEGAEMIPRLAGLLGETARSITLGRPTLEDVFIHATGRPFTEEPGL
jgi:ABC-2 type transport system ATP-binding protein